MKLQDLYSQDYILISIVPLAIDEYGFIYINDIGTINLTINIKHRLMHERQIKVTQIKQLIQHARCHPNQIHLFDKMQQQLLQSLSKYQDDKILKF